MSVNLFFVSISEETYLIILTIITLIATFFIVFFTIHRLRNPYPRLSKYVKGSFNNGRDLSEIRTMLIGAGWEESVVDNELRKRQ